jgi:hypothetical protein
MNAPARQDETGARAGRILACLERSDWARLDDELGRCREAAGEQQTEREELLAAVASRMRSRLRAGRPADEGPEAEAEIWLLEHLARHVPDAYAKPI